MKSPAVLIVLSYLLVLAIALSAAVMRDADGLIFFGVIVLAGLAAAALLPEIASRRPDQTNSR